MPFIPELEGLRGFAFLLVFIAHASQFANAPYRISGKEGLFLFFVLSAYLVTKNFTVSLHEHKNKLRAFINYIVRRIFRIYPMYLIALFFLPEIILSHKPLAIIEKHLLLQLGLEHFWSIPVELKYYILLPFVALIIFLLARKSIRLLFISMCLFLVGYGVFYERISSTVTTGNLGNELSIWLYLPSFIIGSCLSVIPIPTRLKYLIFAYKNTILITLGVIFFISLPFAYHVFIEVDTYTTFYYMLLIFYSFIWSILLYMLIVVPTTILTRIFGYSWFRAMGRISFSAYLWHYSLFLWSDIAGEHGLRLIEPIKILLIFVLTITLASVTYLCIEKPFMKIRVV
jgi:peptidoglycan/LPS O-acetylase OafA/YrhL